MTDPSSQSRAGPSGQKRPGTVGGGNSPRKKPYVDSSPREYYESSGIKANFHGDLYQVKLLMLFLIRGWNMKYSFKLATEMNAAEKFDDLVFERIDKTGGKKYRLLQAKHKQDESKSKITWSQLMSTNDSEPFSLIKYFNSYCKILVHQRFQDGDIEDFTIATNIGIDAAIQGMFKETNVDDEMFKHGLNKMSKCYKFENSFLRKDELVSVLKGRSELQRLAAELANYVKSNKRIDLRNALFKKYQEILVENVLDVGNKAFRGQFVNATPNTDTWRFFQKFATEYQLKGGNLGNINQCKLLIPDTFGKVSSSKVPTFPSDGITDGEINGFFEKLVFAVHQPNEEELSSILKQDLVTLFKFDDIELADVDMVASYFMEYVIDWVKEKNAYFLSHNDVKVVVERAKQKLASQRSIVTTSLHRNDLAKIGACFTDCSTSDKLDNFLTEPSVQILHLIAASTTVGAIKVNEALERDCSYKKNDTHIYTTLKNMVEAETFSTAFQSETNNLLVIECNDGTGNLNLIYSKLKQIMDCKRKKIILITNPEGFLFEWAKLNPISLQDNSSFHNLTIKSQEMLLAQTLVSFLGQEISFDKVVDKCLRDMLKRKWEIEKSIGCVEDKLLLPLVSRKKIEIGEALSSLDDVKDFYIGRTFQRQVLINKAVLKTSGSPNIFALSNLPVSRVLEMNNRQKVQPFSDAVKNDVSAQFIVISDDIAEFEKLCEICSTLGYSIHWLKWVNGCFAWQQSQGKLSILRNFIANDHQPMSRTPRDIMGIEDKFVLIAAEPGMGKTTVLTHLATQANMSIPSLWIIRINLLEFSSELGHAVLDYNSMETAFKLLLAISKMNSPLAAYLFENSCYCGHNVAILFDGFDEISPDHKTKVIMLVRMLISSPISKMWLTTRSHLKHELEDELSVLSYALKPFTRPNQINFLTRFWERNVSCTKSKQKRLNYCLGVFSEQLLEVTYRSIPDTELALTGIPLQTKMLGEAFLNEFQTFFLTEHHQPMLPQKLDILDLYERFVRSKHMIYFDTKVKIQRENNLIASEHVKSSYTNKFKPTLNLLALAAIFTEDECHSFLSKKQIDELQKKLNEMNEGKERSGIAMQNIEGRVIFVHRTFAEYFCANFFTTNEEFQKPKVNAFLRDYMFQEGSGVIRNFFNRMLAKSQTNSCASESEMRNDDYDLHQACMNNNVGKVKEILALGAGCINTQDDGGRTVLHLAATCGHSRIVKILLEKQETLVNEIDDVFSWTPLMYAAKSCHWEIVNMLLEKGATIQDITKVIDVERVYEGSKVLLHIACEKGYVKLVRELVLTLKAHCEVTEENRMIPLHVAAYHNRLEVVQFLVDQSDKRSGIDKHDERNRTPLEVAISQGSMEVVRFLGANDNNLDAMLLHAAVGNGNVDVVASVVRDECVDAMLRGFTALHQAAIRANYPVVKFLVERGADVNLSEPIVSAAGSNHVEMVKLLIELGADIHVGNQDGGFTSLHGAARNGGLDCVRYLIMNKDLNIDVNVTDDKGTTPLQSAAFHDRLDVAEFLLSPNGGNADINPSDWFGATPIFSASLRNYHEMVKLLFRKGARIAQTEGVLGRLRFSVLHAAAAFDAVEIVQMLVEEGEADVNAGQGTSLTPLHIASLFNSTRVIEYLVEKNADVDALIEFHKVSDILKSTGKSPSNPMEGLIPHVTTFVLGLTMLGVVNRILKFTPNNISKLLNFNNEILEEKSTPTWSLVDYIPRKLCQYFQKYINKMRALVEHVKGNKLLPRNVVGDTLVELGFSNTHYIAP